MAAINQIKLNSTSTTYDINDKRISTSAVTTVDYILGSSSSSLTTISPISAENLATALGVGKRGILGGNFNFNTLSDGITSYTTLSGTSNAPISASGSNWGIVITWRNAGAFALQICWNLPSTSFHVRFGDGSETSLSWGAWKQLLFAS